MPYIPQERRKVFDELLAQLGPRLRNKGEINYCVSILMAWYVSVHGENYQNLSDAKDALIDAADEFARRRLAKYEDKKIKENGDLELYYPETKCRKCKEHFAFINELCWDCYKHSAVYKALLDYAGEEALGFTEDDFEVYYDVLDEDNGYQD